MVRSNKIKLKPLVVFSYRTGRYSHTALSPRSAEAFDIFYYRSAKKQIPFSNGPGQECSTISILFKIYKEAVSCQLLWNKIADKTLYTVVYSYDQLLISGNRDDTVVCLEF